MVIHAPMVFRRLIFSSSKMISSATAFMPSSSAPYWPAMTESTSTPMRLNSSKQPHAPERMLAIVL